MILSLVLCLCGMAHGQTAYYWFDSQATSEWHQTNTLNGRFTADVAALLDYRPCAFDEFGELVDLSGTGLDSEYDAEILIDKHGQLKLI